MLECSMILLIVIMVLAFFCEYMDSTLGMGYGTTMTPVLLLFGFSPIQIVPAVLLSELITGILAGIFHSREGNVNFSPKTYNLPRIIKSLKNDGPWISFKKGIPRHLKVAIILVMCSFLGAISAVFTANAIPKFWQQMYIGVVVVSMGIFIIICFHKNFKFSWIKIVVLGIIASFNKGLTGGGYGPIIVSGQVLSGVEGKNAIGITSLAEGLTCVVGVTTYLLTTNKTIDWKLAPFIIMGAVASVPFSVISVKKINPRFLKLAIAVLTVVLGVFTIVKTLKSA